MEGKARSRVTVGSQPGRAAFPQTNFVEQRQIRKSVYILRFIISHFPKVVKKNFKFKKG